MRNYQLIHCDSLREHVNCWKGLSAQALKTYGVLDIPVLLRYATVVLK